MIALPVSEAHLSRRFTTSPAGAGSQRVIVYSAVQCCILYRLYRALENGGRMRVRCITLYSTFAVKAGVKNSGKTWSPNIIQLTVHPQTPPNTIPDLLGCLWRWLPFRESSITPCRMRGATSYHGCYVSNQSIMNVFFQRQ